MTKKFFAVILLLLWVSGDLSYAQGDGAVTKIYSGYLHKESQRHKSFLDAIFGGGAPKEEEDKGRTCSLEFQCPNSPASQPVVQVPGQLTYFIRFKTLEASAPDGHLVLPKEAFKKFTIKAYDNDGESYAIDPDAQGESVGPGGKHHIYDSYLIYLILSGGINNFEIISASNDIKYKYVLDKLEQ